MNRTKLDSVDLWTDVADDLWQVRMRDGSVVAMSLEELDAAFERVEIDAHTQVQRPSGTDWVTVGEAAGLTGDSITPMAVTTYVSTDIPRPPALPKRPLADLTAEELAVVRPARRTGPILAAMGAASLLVGGLVAWKYLPAHPVAALASTTITAPPTDATVPAVQPLEAAMPEAATPPETSPAPEDNAEAPTPPPAKPTKAVKKKPTLKKPHGKSVVTQKKTRG